MSDPHSGPLGLHGRLVVGVSSLLLAIAAGAIALLVGVLLTPELRDAASQIGVAVFVSGLHDLTDGIPPEFAELGAMVALRAVVLLVVAPPLLIILTGVALHFRSFAWHAVGGGLVSAALPLLLDLPSGLTAKEVLLSNGSILALLFCVGSVSGTIYWLARGFLLSNAAHGTSK